MHEHHTVLFAELRLGMAGFYVECQTLVNDEWCGWFGRFFERIDAERHAQRHRALTAQEEGQ